MLSPSQFSVIFVNYANRNIECDISLLIFVSIFLPAEKINIRCDRIDIKFIDRVLHVTFNVSVSVIHIHAYI